MDPLSLKASPTTGDSGDGLTDIKGSHAEVEDWLARFPPELPTIPHDPALQKSTNKSAEENFLWGLPELDASLGHTSVEPVELTSIDPDHTPTAASSVRRVVLPDVLASGMQMHWFEVIAIAQGVCDAMLQAPSAGEQAAPSLERVVLTSSGTAEITAGRSNAGSPVDLVGQILEMGLTENKPVQLRLFLLELKSPTHTETLRQLTIGLEYFERPGRSELIAAVVKRYLDRPQPVVTAQPEKEKLEEPATAPAETSMSEGRPVRQWLAAAIVILAVGGVVGLGLFWMKGARTIQTLSDRSGLTAAPGHESASMAVAERPVSGLKHARLPVTRRPSTSTPSSSDLDGPVVASDRHVGASAGAVNWPAERAMAGGDTQPSSFDIDPRVSNDNRTRVSNDAQIYDGRDPLVTPPTELHPRFPKVPAETPRAEIAVFDLLIDETGNVTSARARTPLKRWDHAMLLSAMKTWRFEPATRDGHPVKYRKEVFVRAPTYW